MEMTNTERIQANNASLRECIETAENLPNAGGSSIEAWTGKIYGAKGLGDFPNMIVLYTDEKLTHCEKTVYPGGEETITIAANTYICIESIFGENINWNSYETGLGYYTSGTHIVLPTQNNFEI